MSRLGTLLVQEGEHEVIFFCPVCRAWHNAAFDVASLDYTRPEPVTPAMTADDFKRPRKKPAPLPSPAELWLAAPSLEAFVHTAGDELDVRCEGSVVEGTIHFAPSCTHLAAGDTRPLLAPPANLPLP